MEKGFLSAKGRGSGKGVKKNEFVVDVHTTVIGGVESGHVTSIVTPTLKSLGDTPDNDNAGLNAYLIGIVSRPPVLFATLVKGDTSRKAVNFCTLVTLGGNGADVVILRESVCAINEWLNNTVYGFFLGKHVAYPVVKNYVKNTLSKFRLIKSMMIKDMFFFKFRFKDGMGSMLKNGPCTQEAEQGDGNGKKDINTSVPNISYYKPPICVVSSSHGCSPMTFDCLNTTPLAERINKLKRKMLDGKPLDKIDSHPVNSDSESETPLPKKINSKFLMQKAFKAHGSKFGEKSQEKENELCDRERARNFLGFNNIKVKLLGGLKVMVLMEHEEMASNVLKDMGHGQRRWGEDMSCKITAVHGTIVGLHNCRIKGNQTVIYGRVHIHAINKGMVKEDLFVRVNGKKTISSYNEGDNKEGEEGDEGCNSGDDELSEDEDKCIQEKKNGDS
nr:RNA-directed DNA polymerase, eukaryota [Tanacetum cinerariifolium]